MIESALIKSISSGSFQPRFINLVETLYNDVQRELTTVTTRHVEYCPSVYEVLGVSIYVNKFWRELYQGVGGRSRKNERDFAVDTTMSVDEILKAIGG